MDILQASALELGEKIQQKEITAVEAMEAVFSKIEQVDETIHSYLYLDKEKAMEQAKEVQTQIEKGELTGPLAGVPIAIKDNICTKDIPTTCASKILQGFRPTFDATAMEQVKKAGMLLVGKTNMDEFAMGSTTETSAFGVTRNPRGTDHVPGGSSGGSAAAVAAKECFLALGSDTGGSIRQPAGYCGVVGMKPTYGTVSRYGLIAYGSSLDQIGPITRNVKDAAALLTAISSKDWKDSTSADIPSREFSALLEKDIRGMRVGLPRDYFTEGLDSQVKEGILKAAKALEARGAIVEEFDLSLVEYAIPAYYTIAAAEASSNLERFDGVKYGYRAADYEGLHQMYKKTRSEGFGEEVKRRIMLGSFVLSSGYYDAYYLKALRVKALIVKAFQKAFETYDCILGPVAPTVAPKLGESLQDPLKMYLGDIYTIAVNLAGLPGICLPCSDADNGLPIGAQLIGKAFEDQKLLQIAYALEQELQYTPSRQEVAENE